MSNHHVEVTPERKAANEKFLAERPENKMRFIRRHTLQARLTHDVTIICCIWLMISGLFVFVPPLAAAVGQDVVFFIRMSHRVIGVLYIAVPLISAILAPKGVKHILNANITKWTKDDVLWLLLFMPYLFGAKWIHMPDQDESKSGQRFADGMLWIFGFEMAITGLILLLGSTVFTMSTTFHGVMLWLHDFGFFVLVVFVLAHIFLGAGIFQPYKGTAGAMFGNGLVSESYAMYHWGHWAREVLADGTRVCLLEVDEKGRPLKNEANKAAIAEMDARIKASEH